MRETYSYTPIIKLPKSKGSSPRSMVEELQMSTCDPKDCLVSETLFVDDVPNSIRDADIRTLLQHCMPQDMHINRNQGNGYLRFSHPKYADKAYALYNKFTFTNGATLQLRIHRDPLLEPQPKSNVLQVKNLPDYINETILYDVFRPLGPLSLCRLYPEPSGHQPTAYIRYFSQKHANQAQRELNEKSLQGRVISVTVALTYTPSEGIKRTESTQEEVEEVEEAEEAEREEKIDPHNVDFLNLYIKNLDLSINNDDLRTLFGKFGRIVSARVMSNPSTGISKGYGFVSFGKSEEAQAALSEMNGFMVGGKPLLVAFHEPKKKRQDKQPQRSPHGNTHNYSPPFASPMINMSPQSSIGYHGKMGRPEVSYFASDIKQAHEMHNGPYGHAIHGNRIDMDYKDTLVTHLKELSVGSLQSPAIQLPKRKPSTVDLHGIHSGPHPGVRHSPQFSSPSTSGVSTGLLTNASLGLAVPSAHYRMPHKVEMPPSLKRRDSIDSVSSYITESNCNIQRQRLAEAVMQCGDYSKYMPDLVDLLLTLKCKERSLCLFNQDFLRGKISQAIEAIEIFDEAEEESPEKSTPTPMPPVAVAAAAYSTTAYPPTNYSPAAYSPAAYSVAPFSTPLPGMILPPRRGSKAIPIVAPPPEASPQRALDISKESVEDKAAKLLKSLEGKAIIESKQLLGDKLFPLVKATGTKQAPKVTIRLLDTLDLHSLAHIMYNPSALKEQVSMAFAAL
ncbi:hypothetical protein BDF14DRAFT_1849502 [Spinellus fusiger]|nr:hypothetical protein BDF14DRAFT_1849502 [Spinellus fusiger]